MLTFQEISFPDLCKPILSLIWVYFDWISAHHGMLAKSSVITQSGSWQVWSCIWFGTQFPLGNPRINHSLLKQKVVSRLTCWKLEGAQRVHISAKYMIMLWCTRLHVYISTPLCTCAASLPMIMTSSITTRAVPNSGCVLFGRIRIIDATIRPNTNRIRIVEVWISLF